MEAVLTLDRAVRSSLAFLQELLGNLPLGEVAVRLWDGTVWKNTPRPRCTLVLKHPGALRRMFMPTNQLSLGEAYLYDDFDIEGDIEVGFTLADSLLEMNWGLGEKLRLGRYLWSLPVQERPALAERGARLSGRAH